MGAAATLCRRRFNGIAATSKSVGLVCDAARVVTPAVQLDVIKEDRLDNRIPECAVSGGSDYTVTGDKDLPRDAKSVILGMRAGSSITLAGLISR
jgi:hypothetical protein